jgi:hypothetical protein
VLLLALEKHQQHEFEDEDEEEDDGTNQATADNFPAKKNWRRLTARA